MKQVKDDESYWSMQVELKSYPGIVVYAASPINS